VINAVAEAAPETTWKIRHADCMDFLAGLPDESVDVVVTDPAYSGMNQHLRFGSGRIVGNYQSENNTRWFTEFSDDEARFLALLGECHRVLRRDRHIYIMFDSFSLLTLAPLMRQVFDVKNVIVWDKVRLGMGHYFRRRHELVVFASKGRRKLLRKDLADIWAVPRLTRAQYPTQKPVALFSRMLEGSVDPGFVVCDPFTGSGSSAIAALRAGCSFLGADVSERAVELTTSRCQVFSATGADPLEPGS
jgi:site-specific DNA-methyltransferase (adenine-specific)